MNFAMRCVLAVVCLGAVASCSSVSIETYADNKPRLVAEEFFNGKLTAHGIVKDRGGEVIRYKVIGNEVIGNLFLMKQILPKKLLPLSTKTLEIELSWFLAYRNYRNSLLK